MSDGKYRWNFLRQALLTKTLPKASESICSKRRFRLYSDFFELSDLETSLKIQIKVNESSSDQNDNNNFEIELDHTSLINNHLDLQSLKEFDRTGRLCIWPSEQILTYWVLKNLHFFQDKSILEIGGGFHCIGALAAAKFGKAKQVVLTDGDQENCLELERSIIKNTPLNSRNISVSLLRWDNFEKSAPLLQDSKFDYIFCADIIYNFNSTSFQLLIETLEKLLKSGTGKCILFNPPRESNLSKFISLVRDSGHFKIIEVTEHYDPYISKIVENLKKVEEESSSSSFNPDSHYPLKVVFEKL